jgi:hypothetical protein
MPFDGSTNPNVAIVQRMRQALKQRGWCKNVLEDSGGRVCLYGALNVATYGAPYWNSGLESATLNALRPLRDKIYQTMQAEAGCGLEYASSAVIFNNAPETTFEDILAFLDRVEARLIKEAEHAV